MTPLFGPSTAVRRRCFRPCVPISAMTFWSSRRRRAGSNGRPMACRYRLTWSPFPPSKPPSCWRWSAVNSDALASAALHLRAWLTEQALPFWAAAGFDREHGRFEEKLDLSGRPIRDVPARLMVQARQIYVYGLAARRGWYGDAASLLQQAFASMVRDY